MTTTARRSRRPAIALIAVGACASLAGILDPVLALVAGALVTSVAGEPLKDKTASSFAKPVLAISIVGLGASLTPSAVIATGWRGVLVTTVTVALTFAFGTLFARLLKVPRKTATLITFGTAICGGSAIAAGASVLDADEKDTGSALATVFLLNGIALFLFPLLGTLLSMSGEEFGTWSALAVHDMSSVVGAAHTFGQGSLDTAIPMKLTRALWILPVSFVVGRLITKPQPEQAGRKTKKKQNVPLVPVGFAFTVLAFSYLPILEPLRASVTEVSHRLLVLAIFLVGTALTPSLLKKVGFRPIALGVLLWIVAATLSLVLVYQVL
jgi:uncharacterized integral membrane protein (TIGR00698 family)